MGKVRVHELAKELNLSNQALIKKLNAAGMSVKSHSNSVDRAAAMKALGSGDDKKAAKPRTIVRRRRRAEPEPEPTVVETAPEPVVAEAAPEPAAAVVVSRPEPEAKPEPVAAPEPTPEAPVAAPVEAANPVEAKPEVAPKATEAPKVVAPEPAKAAAPAAEAAAPAAEAAPATPAADAPKADAAAAAPTNVVRKIDPEQIRKRLAAEGRNFAPKRRSFTKVREFRVVNNRGGGGAGGPGRPSGPRPGGGPGGPGGPGGAPNTGGGARPSGKRKGRSEPWKERREQRGGPRDQWMRPGKKRKSAKRGKSTELTTPAAHKRVVEVIDEITVSELAHKMSVKTGQLIGRLMGMGMMVTVNQTIDFDTVSIIAEEFGFEVKSVAFEEKDFLDLEEDAAETLEPRAPVVTVMGHVDHGKTSLLDAVRNADVAAGEAGGITQHIGAYSVETDHGPVTFLDTPGHAAFTSMRARGAQITDVVVLVVAADDGVMPQTIEAINHAKSANVPLVVAINKIDKPGARPERVLQELTEHGVVPEAWGGDAQTFNLSAKTGEGITELLEGLAMQTEIMELQANPNRTTVGTIVEARLDKGRGPVATVLVQRGTLKKGDFVVGGVYSGRVRALIDSHGKRLKEAGPSTPVQVLGLSGVPGAGDRFDAVKDDKTAKTVAGHRAQMARDKELRKSSRVSLENFLKTNVNEERHDLNLIVKADVHGSVEALSETLRDLSTTKVTVRVLHSGVGAVTESDVNLAVSSGAIIIGFNTKADAKAAALAAHEQVDMRTYGVIYDAVDEIKRAMLGLLAPKKVEEYRGRAEVRQVFRASRIGTIAGSYVLDGKMVRAGQCRLIRAGEVVHEGRIGGLKRFKDDAKEVGAGFECGIGVAGFNDFHEGDLIECFEMVEVEPDIDEALGENLKELEEKKAAAEKAGASA